MISASWWCCCSDRVDAVDVEDVDVDAWVEHSPVEPPNEDEVDALDVDAVEVERPQTDV